MKRLKPDPLPLPRAHGTNWGSIIILTVAGLTIGGVIAWLLLNRG